MVNQPLEILVVSDSSVATVPKVATETPVRIGRGDERVRLLPFARHRDDPRRFQGIPGAEPITRGVPIGQRVDRALICGTHPEVRLG